MKSIRTYIVLFMVVLTISTSSCILAKKPKEQKEGKLLVESANRANDLMKTIINGSAAVTYFAAGMYAIFAIKQIIRELPEGRYYPTSFEELFMLTTNFAAFITLLEIAYQRGCICTEAFKSFFNAQKHRSQVVTNSLKLENISISNEKP